jgi:hypothetical protein
MTRKPGKPRAAKRKIDRKNGKTKAIARWERELLAQRRGGSVRPYGFADIYGPLIRQQLDAGAYTTQYGPMRAAMDKGPITVTKSGAILHTSA